jgi:hypothetical protein
MSERIRALLRGETGIMIDFGRSRANQPDTTHNVACCNYEVTGHSSGTWDGNGATEAAPFGQEPEADRGLTSR